MEQAPFRRAHPIMILYHLRSVLYLIIIPFLRGLVAVIQGGLSAWGQGIWLDFLILFGMLGISVLRWFLCRYRYDESHIRMRSGVFFYRDISLDWDKVTTLSVIRSLVLRPVRAVLLRVDTMGGNRRDADISLYLHRSDVQEMIGVYSAASGREVEEDKEEVYRPSFPSILALSALSTNSFVGVVYIATFISQSGRILGDRFSQMLIGTFEELARTLAFNIPPAAAAIAYIMLIAWLVGVIFALLRYKGFSVRRKGDSLRLYGGLFTHREYVITTGNVNYLDIRQNMLTYLLRLYSMYISAVGCGKDRSDLTCVIPFESIKKFRQRAHQLFPGFQDCPLTVRPYRDGILRYLSDPLLFCLAIPLAMVTCFLLLPSWFSFILFVGIMALIPALFFFAMRFTEYLTSGVGRADGLLTMRYSFAFTLHTLIIPEDKIAKVVIRQSLFQRIGGHNCDLLVYTVSEGSTRHKCRNLKRTEVEAFFGLSQK